MASTKPPLWWLPDLIAHLGPPETSTDDPERWTWRGGAVGVSIVERDHLWNIVAWTPDRTVILRAAAEPSDADIGRAVMLAGLRALPAVARTR
jgi:hypothetical protein